MRPDTSMSWKAGEASVDKKFRISGPGAADFLTSEGGVDFPETDPSKGMTQTREDGVLNNAAELANLDTNPLVSGAFRERAARHPRTLERGALVTAVLALPPEAAI